MKGVGKYVQPQRPISFKKMVGQVCTGPEVQVFGGKTAMGQVCKEREYWVSGKGETVGQVCLGPEA